MKLLFFFFPFLLSPTLGTLLTSKSFQTLDNYDRVNQETYDVTISNSLSREYSTTASFLDEGRHSKEDYDFTCAIENDKEQKSKYPGWNYAAKNVIAANSEKQSLSSTWEPILEPVQGCNGLSDAYLKKFSFLFVLDGSWVDHYQKNSHFFKKQGYHSLETSPYILIDKVNFLYEKQFGIHIAARKIVSFPSLKNACKTNNLHADDGTPATSTKWHLKNGNVVSLPSDGGIIRLGTGLPDSYCHSTSPITNGCHHNGIVTNQQKIFDGNTGRFNHRSAVVLAHELAHFFGICPNGNSDCTHAHTRNDIPDIMVWNGTPAKNARPEGMFYKFFTTCSTVYKDVMCKNIQKAPASCGVKTAKKSKYLGCFKDSSNRALKHHRGHGSVAQCQSSCKSYGFKYAGRQWSGECWCGNSGYDKYGKENGGCNCDGSNVGPWRNCVYEVPGGSGVKYLGCFKEVPFKDSSNRALKHHRGHGLSVPQCQSNCKSSGFKYAGRQWSGECWCGNSGYDKYGKENGGCNCDGGNVGPWRNCVYEVGAAKKKEKKK